MIYEPEEDSFLLEKYVLRFSNGKRVVDMGCGSGVQSIAALKAHAKSVLSADIDQESLDHCKHLGLKTVKSDLFSKVRGRFDLIIFNPPYLPDDKREDKESKKSTTGGINGDEIIIKFLMGAKKHLNKNGIILLLVSSLTPQNKINKGIEKIGLKKKRLEKKKLFMESLEVWKIY